MSEIIKGEEDKRIPQIVGESESENTNFEIDDVNYNIIEENGNVYLMGDNGSKELIASGCNCLEVRYIPRSRRDGIIVCLLQDKNNKDIKLATTHFFYHTDYTKHKDIIEHKVRVFSVDPEHNIHIFDDFQIGFNSKDGKALLCVFGHYMGKYKEIDIFNNKYAKILGIKEVEFNAINGIIELKFDFRKYEDRFSIKLFRKYNPDNKVGDDPPDTNFRFRKKFFGIADSYFDSSGKTYSLEGILQAVLCDIINNRFPIDGIAYSRILGKDYKRPIKFAVDYNQIWYGSSAVIYYDPNLDIILFQNDDQEYVRNSDNENFFRKWLLSELEKKHNDIGYYGTSPNDDAQLLRFYLRESLERHNNPYVKFEVDYYGKKIIYYYNSISDVFLNENSLLAYDSGSIPENYFCEWLLNELNNNRVSFFDTPSEIGTQRLKDCLERKKMCYNKSGTEDRRYSRKN